MLDIEPAAPLFTITWNVTVAVPAISPDLAGILTSIPFTKLSAVSSGLSVPSTTTLPSTNFVFVGISSLIIAVPASEPVFVAVIVYVIVSPATTTFLSADLL